MALKSIVGKVKTLREKIADTFNGEVQWQHSNAENITDATLYEDDEGFSIYVGGDGDVTVQLKNGGEVTYYGILAGTFMPIVAIKVLASTTATNLVVGR